MTTQPYVYQVDSVAKVTDGDTYWMYLSIGFRETILVNVRLAGFDCPERNSGSDREKAAAKDATDLAAMWLAEGPVWVRTEKDPDSFGRWLGYVWRDTTDGGREFLGDVLRDQGLASVWP
ncbi:MAG: hypothetical protein HOQ21_01375, partial [Dermatophilaceae bacterium]|nr:hypothetical protein [Dermatophilaceae bacterium]